MDVGYNGRLYDHFESTVGVLQKIAIAVIMYSWYKWIIYTSSYSHCLHIYCWLTLNM